MEGVEANPPFSGLDLSLQMTEDYLTVGWLNEETLKPLTSTPHPLGTEHRRIHITRLFMSKKRIFGSSRC